jgi:hypothetical protein
MQMLGIFDALVAPPFGPDTSRLESTNRVAGFLLALSHFLFRLAVINRQIGERMEVVLTNRAGDDANSEGLHLQHEFAAADYSQFIIQLDRFA